MTLDSTNPPEEEARLGSLWALDLLDTPAEAQFDDITALAASICEAPMALISLVDLDRQWFKSRVGVDAPQTPRSQSVCAYTMMGDSVLEIPDTRLDPRTVDNPLVEDVTVSMKFYAGAPLVTSDGVPLGALCVLDRKPRQLTDMQRNALAVLGRQVMTQIELRMALKGQRRALDEAQSVAQELREALRVQEILSLEIDHRVKNSLQQVTAFLRLQARNSDSEDLRAALEDAQRRVMAVASIHAELHRSSASDEVSLSHYLVNLGRDMSESAGENVTIRLLSDDMVLPTTTATSLAMIVNEFVANSLKYAFPGGRAGQIEARFVREGAAIVGTLTDDGIGYAGLVDEAKPKGLGMRIMEAAASQLEGEMTFEPPVKGTRMILRLPFPVGRAAA